MTRVFVVASLPAIRIGLRVMLEDAGLEVADEASSLFDLDGLGGALGDSDVLVVAGDTLLANAAGVLEGDPPLSLVVLSDDMRIAGTLQRLPIQAWSLLPSDAPVADLMAAIASVARGLIALPHALADELLAAPPPEAPVEPLTEREREVL
ncbi:MAG: DNA-binding response regulator [Ardenticatenaceae bacterium]